MEAGWFGGPIMEKLIDTGFEYVKDQFRWQTGMKEELQRLRDIHPKIQAVVAFASTQVQIRDQNSPLDKWIWQLRDAIDEADDVLDDFEYMMHEEQLMTRNEEEKEQMIMTRNKEETKVRSIASFLIESACKKIGKVGERALKIDPNLKRLEEAVQKLDKVSAEVSTFLPLLESTKQELLEQQLELYRTRETGSLPKNDLIGRGKDKEFVMQWLRKPSNEEHRATLYKNISFLSIVGHGGMGKTTLLQHVYEDEMTEKFDLKMWVCISNNFDVKKVIADMLEYLKKERPRLESIGTLQESLKSAVKSNKFLLVLDDIWGEDEERDKSKWENVLAPLAYGSLGSKILVTTRMDSVASMIAKVIKKKKETLRLEGLEEAECLQLLNSHAFADVENPDDHRKLRSIAGEIVKKLSGSPLAAKVIGGVLNSSLDESHWKKILNNAIGSQNDVVPILRLSYLFLPKHLQNCFTFCCIFSQDHKFDKDDLVRMWISLDFIQKSYNRGETVEDIGENYFDVLVKKSFFEKFQTKYETYYKMHDLLHQLAQSISSHECFRVVADEELPIPETIRYLSVEIKNIEVLRKMKKFKNMRSLFLSYNTDNQYFIDVLIEILEASRSLRLLHISAPYLKVIPEVIGYLIHLRYLWINTCHLLKLPRSLNNLYHLQYINFNSLHIDFSSIDINNLSNLRYLKSPWYGSHMVDRIRFRGIGKLKFLQKLDWFKVEDESGYRIEELKHMNELRQLKIYFLENVKDAEEACNIKLCDKRNLTDLNLRWCDDGERNNTDPNLDEKVLDNIQPHNNLKKLSINAYMGVRSAIWMNNVNLISNLEYIKLHKCLEWQTLPSFGQLPFLKSLYLQNMPKAKRLDNNKDCVFPSLEVLHIEDLQALGDWFDAAVAAEDVYLFPCLTELHLKNCPNLQELPFLPPKLKELKIDTIGWKALNWLQVISNSCSISIHNFSNLISLRGRKEVETTENRQLILSELVIKDPSILLTLPLRSITLIEKLTIRENYELVSFPIEAEQWFLQVSSSLCELEFIDLKSLQSLPFFLESLSSLKSLRVYNAPQLQLLPNIPSSLERLVFQQLESLQCLPSSLPAISSLNFLYLKIIPLLKSLPDLPPFLYKLHLEHLDNLDCLPSCLLCLSSLQELFIGNVPQLRELPDLPPSLCKLELINLDNLDCLPSCLPSLSSLQGLDIINVPQLRELPDLPPSLCKLYLNHLDNLDCLRLPSFSSLQGLDIINVPQLRELPDLPPSLCELYLHYLENLDCLRLPSLSSLRVLHIEFLPQLRELPDLPPSLCKLYLNHLDNLDCLRLPSFSSLQNLSINSFPQLRELPDLPPSLCELYLHYLKNLDCLRLPSLSSLRGLHIEFVPQLRELPDLPPSLEILSIRKCHPEFVERYKKSSGSDWHKIAHIPYVNIS